MTGVFAIRSNARHITSIGVAGLLSTLVAILTAAVFLFVVALPSSMIIFLIPPILFQALFYVAIWAVPLTLVILPVAALFLRRGLAAMLGLPIVGLIGGGLSIWIWHFFTATTPPEGPGFELLVVTGAIAGLAAGGSFGRALYELGK